MTSETVDLQNGVLCIRQTKFRKDRLVPVHPSTVEKLRSYQSTTEDYRTKKHLNVFFLDDNAKPLNYRAVLYRFIQLGKELVWGILLTGRYPRLHDIRHTFAARRLLQWCKDGHLKLPGKKYTGEITPRRSREPAVDGKKPFNPLSGDISMFAPVSLELVENRRQRELFKDLLGRYHYLGYAMPYGVRLQYLAYVERPRREVVGCIQYSSPAWRMKTRDRWIGWNDATRGLRLQHVVNNSRFLVVANIHERNYS